jgi:hypothetical protein
MYLIMKDKETATPSYKGNFSKVNLDYLEWYLWRQKYLLYTKRFIKIWYGRSWVLSSKTAKAFIDTVTNIKEKNN